MLIGCLLVWTDIRRLPKIGASGLFGESAFLSLCVHDYRPGAIEQLIRGSPYRVPNADNSSWHNPEGY